MSRVSRGVAFMGILGLFCLGAFAAGQAPADSPIIIDHSCAVLGDIPESWIVAAKQTLHIAYGHTSHGSQLTTGMSGLISWKGDLYSWNFGGSGGALDIREWDYGVGFGYPDSTTWAVDLGNPDRSAWATATREYLNNHPEINVIIWSWCWQMITDVVADIDLYLDLMNGLEEDYPNVKFVYMTGHVTAGQEWGEGTAWSHMHYMRAKQIRDYCTANNKILFDFAEIESWDPDGNWYGDKLVDDACNYDSNGDGVTDRNWAIDWQNAHPGEWFPCESAHSQPLNANLKAYAAWHLWARLAGWTGPPGAVNKVDFNNDGQEDILWRYYGAGGYNRVWFLGNSEPIGLQASAVGVQMGSSLVSNGMIGNAASERSNRFPRDMGIAPGKNKRSAPGAPRNLMGGLKRATRRFQVADPRRAGGRGIGLSPQVLADPRQAKSDVSTASPSGAPIEPASMPALLGGADLLPVGDVYWWIVGMADFNNDTHVDILWRNMSNGSNVVWFMNRTEWTGSAELLPVGDLYWEIVGTGDFNNDTHPDILWRNAADGSNVVWYMNETTWIGSAVLLGVSDPAWEIAGTGDFNNDGHVDILWRYNQFGGYNVVWYMNDATWIGSAGLIPVEDLSWEIACTGDYNKDGKVDILWRYQWTGSTCIWYMNGSTWIGGGDLLQVPDTTWKIVAGCRIW